MGAGSSTAVQYFEQSVPAESVELTYTVPTGLDLNGKMSGEAMLRLDVPKD